MYEAYVDGASSGNPGDAGCGIILFSPSGEEILRESLYIGRTTNNVAEYTAIKRALSIALEMGIKELTIYSDSSLVVNQLNGRFRVRDKNLLKHHDQVISLARGLDRFLVKYIPRDGNKIADKLAKEAIRRGRRVAAPKEGEESPGTAGQDGL